MTSTSDDPRVLLQCGYRFALSLAHDEERASDLVQDAWLLLLKANAPRSRVYLFATIRNRFIDLCRREKLVKRVPFVDDVATACDDREMCAVEDLSPILSNGELERALALLRPEERAALYLSVVEGFTAQRIADLFEWPRGTVLSHIHRARGKLKRYAAERRSTETDSEL